MEDMEKVYQRHAQTVYKFLLAQCHDPGLAEELTQETFYQAVRSVDRFDGSCKVSVWLCQIGKNCWLTHLRKEKHRCSEEELERLTAPQNIEEDFFSKENVLRIHKELHQLPEPYREVFTLRVFAELTFAQIGELFAKSESWARVTCYRAKLKLKERIQ